MNPNEKQPDDKIDVEDLIGGFLINNVDGLSKYLKAIWKVRIFDYLGFISKK